jgi:hypothetical protein
VWTNALTARGDASDSLRFEMYDSGSALVARLRRRFGGPDQARTRIAAERRRGGEADHLEGVIVQRDRLAETQVRHLAKDRSTATPPRPDPRPVRHPGLADRGHATLTSFDLHQGNEVRAAQDGPHRAGDARRGRVSLPWAVFVP